MHVHNNIYIYINSSFWHTSLSTSDLLESMNNFLLNKIGHLIPLIIAEGTGILITSVETSSLTRSLQGKHIITIIMIHYNSCTYEILLTVI